MKIKFYTFLIFILTTLGYAQDKNKKLNFIVDGNCQMCKLRIEKAALGVKGVKVANWSVPTHELTLIIDERKTNHMQIKTAIAAVGHDSEELKATQDAYDKVYPCCKYRDEDSEQTQEH